MHSCRGVDLVMHSEVQHGKAAYQEQNRWRKMITAVLCTTAARAKATALRKNSCEIPRKVAQPHVLPVIGASDRALTIAL